MASLSESEARTKPVILTTDASITVKLFFEKRGYVVLKQQSVESGGQILINYKMIRGKTNVI